MKIGLNTDGVRHLSLDQTLDLVAELGLDYVEFATGNWSSAPHVDLQRLHADAGARRDLLAKLAERNLQISALTCSGNPLHRRPLWFELAPGAHARRSGPAPEGVRHDATTGWRP